MNQITPDWQARAALCELLSLSFVYPKESTLIDVLVSGEWFEAAAEIANILDVPLSTELFDAAAAEVVEADPEALSHQIRKEATRLFVGTPVAVVSPYEGVWRAVAAGKAPLMFVGEESLDVERFCKSCGLGQGTETNDPLDAVWSELELLGYLALRVNAESDDEADNLVPDANLPGGSPEAAWGSFIDEHAKKWMPGFSHDVMEKSQLAFYRAAAALLDAFVSRL